VCSVRRNSSSTGLVSEVSILDATDEDGTEGRGKSPKAIEGLLGLEAHFKDGHRLRKPFQVKLALGNEI
jgi:hypothetical protein